jgi:hypothetical protein
LHQEAEPKMANLPSEELFKSGYFLVQLKDTVAIEIGFSSR